MNGGEWQEGGGGGEEGIKEMKEGKEEVNKGPIKLH